MLHTVKSRWNWNEISSNEFSSEMDETSVMEFQEEPELSRNSHTIQDFSEQYNRTKMSCYFFDHPVSTLLYV